MKKIIVVFDGGHFPSATLDFARSLNFEQPILLTGVFLPSVDYAKVTSYYYYSNAVSPVFIENYEEDAVAIKKNIGLFEDFCREHHIRYNVHQEVKGKVVKEIQLETRYADLLLLSSSQFYENLGATIQEEYLSDTLHKAECPLILLPGVYRQPEKIIFTYDGSASSMHAMKQFIYLFPHFTDLDTLIVYTDIQNGEIPAVSMLQEYAQQHFSRLAYYRLNIDAEKYFGTWIENRGAALIVSGAYGRSSFSEFFRKSFMEKIVHEQEAPLFIAHP